MNKKHLCILLLIIIFLQSNIALANYSENDKDASTLESFGNYIVFPVSSKKASEYSCLHWKTQGFIVTVFDKNGDVVKADKSKISPNPPPGVSDKHPFLKYSSAAAGERNFAVAIYSSSKGVVKGISGADGDITESIEDLYGPEAFKDIKKTGGKIKLEPLFTVFEGNVKTRIKVGNDSYKYVQEDFKDLGLYYTVEQMDAGKWLGVEFPDSSIADMATRRQLPLEFGPESDIDFYPVILRTGTEDGYYPGDEEQEYEAIVEMNALNYDEALVPNIKISITGGELCDKEGSVIEGGCTLSENTLKAWLEDKGNLAGTKKLPNLISKSNSIDWLAYLTSSNENKQYRLSPRELQIRNKSGSNIYFNSEDNTAKRYYVFKWKSKRNASKVKIQASINTDKKIDDEKNFDNNIDTAQIYNSSTYITDKYLDYDVYSKSFELDVNNGNKLEAKVLEPESRGYLFSYSWATATTGNLAWSLKDDYGLVDNSYLYDINNQYGVIIESYNSIIRMPVVRWVTTRLGFGYNQSTGIYSNIGGLTYSGDKKDNSKAPKISFTINTSGNISRQANIAYYTGYSYHSHSDSCYTETTDDEGVKSTSLTCGESEGGHYYGYTTDTVTQSSDFQPKPAKDDVLIQALIYNGTSIPLKDYSDDEGVTTKNKGWDNILVWEGDRYQIPVKRYMRVLDQYDVTTDLIETPGFYGKTRTFQHLDEARISLSEIYTLEDNFEADREKAKNNAKNYKNMKFDTAPFATDLELQRFEYPIKAGYFYVPYSIYEAKVKTVKYINGDYTGRTSEHERIVDNVKNAFGVQLGIPTIDSSKNRITDLPILKTERYELKSNKELGYDAGPNSINDYLSGTETTLLGKTDKLYKAILEGWSFSGTEDSWGGISDTDAFKYREYVSDANIHRVEEETTITFTVNPERIRYYINIQAKNGPYKINVSLGQFTNGRTKPLTAKGPASWDAITFTVKGSRLDDLNN